MSFQRSPGDILALIDELYRKCKAVGGRYLEVSRELGSLHSVIRHLYEVEAPESFHNRDKSKHGSELIPIIRNCNHTLRQLDDLLYRNRKAVDERDNWDSPRLESSEIDSLNDIRNKLNNHKTTIAVFLDTVQLQHDALVSKTVDSQGGQLDIILDKLDNIAERMGQRAGSMLTSYGSDDKETWKEFRRELIAEGFSSDVLQRNKEVLRAYIREIDQKGLLTEGPQTPVSASHSVSTEWLDSVPSGRPPGTAGGHSLSDEGTKEVVVDEENVKFPQSMKLERARPNSQDGSRDIQHSISALTIDTKRGNDRRVKPLIKPRSVNLEVDSSSDESYTSSRSQVSIMRTSDLTDFRNLPTEDRNFLRPPQSRRPSRLQLEAQGTGNSRSSSPASISSKASTRSTSQQAVLDEHAGSPTQLRGSSRSPGPRLEPLAIPAKGKPNDEHYSRSPQTNSFTLAPDSMGNRIPVDAKWTKIRRSLVSLEILDQDGHRYEARPSFVAVLGTLSHEEIEDLVLRSSAIREARYHRHETPRQPSPRKAPQNFRYTRAKANGDGTPSDDEDSSSGPKRHQRRTRSSSSNINHEQFHPNAPLTPEWSPNLQPPPGFWPPTSPPPGWQPQGYPYPYAPPNTGYGTKVPPQRNSQPTIGYYPPPQPYYSAYPPQDNRSHRNRRHGESEKRQSQGKDGKNASRNRWRENLAAAGLGGAAVSLLSVLSEAAAEF